MSLGFVQQKSMKSVQETKDRSKKQLEKLPKNLRGEKTNSKQSTSNVQKLNNLLNNSISTEKVLEN